MLRTLVFVLALAAPGVAFAQQQGQFPESAVGAEVRGDDGGVLGHVGHVERDADGRIVAVEIAGLEPGDAPYAPPNLVSENYRRDTTVPVSDTRRERRASGGERTAAR